MSKNRKVLVLGAGVSGLSSGILLLRQGFSVTIWAKDLPPNTTSNKAAAVWYPFIVKPPEKATRWARITIDFFQKHILGNSETGTKRMKVIEVFEKSKEDPWWKNGVDSFRRTTKNELPDGYIDGYAIEGFIMETDTYMEYLVNWFKRLGGKIVQKEIQNIKEPFEKFNLVVNCTGLGSREILGDKQIYPTRGQIVVIKHNGFDHSIFEEEGRNSLSYIIPRINDIVLGGTAQENNWNIEVDPKDTEEILQKCANVRSEFKDVEIIGYRVGLRPSRNEVRLELEKYSDGKYLVHNYGHGGSGFTLSWGCAKDVVDYLLQIAE